MIYSSVLTILLTFSTAADDDDSNEVDELTKFTAARFSTTPNKELATSIISRSQPSPLTSFVDGSNDVQITEVCNKPGN